MLRVTPPGANQTVPLNSVKLCPLTLLIKTICLQYNWIGGQIVTVFQTIIELF